MSNVSEQNDMLSALLVLVTNGDKVAQNISALKEHIAKHTDAKAGAISATQDAARRISDADAREDEVRALGDALAKDRQAFADEVALFAKEKDAFAQKKAEHVDAVNGLIAREKDLLQRIHAQTDSEKTFAKASDAKSGELANRELGVREAEDRAQKHEADAAFMSAKLKAQMESIASALGK